MDHKKSIFIFEKDDTEWIVEYYYTDVYWSHSNTTRKEISAKIYENGVLYHDFENKLPYTKTENPTKTQAKEIISAAKKINKEKDKRDKKLKSILN
jgi:hypothetical protein